MQELQYVQQGNTIICRCEDVARAEVLAACGEGANDILAVKTRTRAGMGRCQGRICRMSLTACISSALGIDPKIIGYNRPRIPLRPIPIDQLIAVTEPADKDLQGTASPLPH